MQLYRSLRSLGPYIFLVSAVMILLIYVCSKTYRTVPEAWYTTALLAAACFALQVFRRDISFARLHLRNPHLQMYLEYAALTFPFAAPSLLTAQWYCFIALQPVLLLIPLYTTARYRKTYFRSIPRIIPSGMFEWISGFRRSFVIILLLYLPAFALSWFRILPLFLLWLLTLTVLSFYEECEPLNILHKDNLTVTKFLKEKLLLHARFLILLYAPVLIVHVVFNTEYWHITLLFLLMQLALLSFAVMLKYSTYTPASAAGGNSIVLSIVGIGSIIPFLLPVPLVMAFIYYFRAKANLRHYLDD